MAGKKKKAARSSEKPPQTFAVQVKDEKDGKIVGYAIAELVVYFPIAVGHTEKRHDEERLDADSEDAVSIGRPEPEPRGGSNAATPAFASLFAHAATNKRVMNAISVRNGVVSDAMFRVEMVGMSGDNFYSEFD